MRVIPLGHRILVQPDEIETETEHGIIIVQDERVEKANQQWGTLIAYGPQAWKAFSLKFDGEPWAQVGDKVMFSRYAGSTIVDPENPEVEYKLLSDEDLCCAMTQDK